MLEHWFYKRDDDWYHLPDWCRAYSALGQAAAKYNPKGRRLTVGLAAPTRAYGAVFASVGYVLARAELPVEQIDCTDHFLRLCNLPPQTPVTYRESDRVLRAILEGYEEHCGTSYIVIRINSGHAKRKVPVNLATNIQISNKDIIKLPKHQAGKRALSDSSLLSACKVNFDIREFCLRSRLDVTIIGNKTVLFHELNIPLAAKDEGGEFRTGTLSEVLRVREHVTSGLGYRTSLRSERDGSVTPDPKGVPPVVIFDSAAGFLKWRDMWRESSWIVILDKAETGFEQAVATLNQEYINSHLDDTALSLPELPPGVDVLAYEEQK